MTSIPDEISVLVQGMSPSQQAEALHPLQVKANNAQLVGRPGKDQLRFAGVLPPEVIQAMREACELIDDE